jgi:hypothetical protein
LQPPSGTGPKAIEPATSVYSGLQREQSQWELLFLIGAPSILNAPERVMIDPPKVLNKLELYSRGMLASIVPWRRN